MKKKTFSKRFNYWFDCMMSKGSIGLSLLLLAATSLIVGVIGLIAYFVADDGGFLYQLWYSFMYTLDPGNLSDVPMDNVLYLFLMLLATICGLLLTSILIGIVSTGIEDKLNALRKGTSVVQEDDHTVIIGFDKNIYTLLRELIEANASKKNACIVVLGTQPKSEMEDAIASHIQSTQTTRIICRSGSLHEQYALERCSIETCRSVIVNIHDDAETIKTLLALAAYVKDKQLKNPALRFVASLQSKQYIEAAELAGEGRATVFSTKDAIARIISNTCRQHGLSQVLTEMFSFSGNELYFEKIPELVGKTFHEAVLSFANATVIGLYTNGVASLKPPMDTIVTEDDQIILLEMDDGAHAYQPTRSIDEEKIRNTASVAARARESLLVLGSNDKLPVILSEYAKFVAPGTKVLVVDDDLDVAELGNFENLEISICAEEITRDLLCGLLGNHENNILLLNDDSQDHETSDSLTLLRLILLRDIADKGDLQFSITTEMRNVDNQRLASQVRVDDFVIGSNFSSLLMAQIAENPDVAPLIDELLDESGSELYIKPVTNYVPAGVPVDLYTLSESAARKNEIFFGYRLYNGKTKYPAVINPRKDTVLTFGEQDRIVVVAED